MCHTAVRIRKFSGLLLLSFVSSSAVSVAVSCLTLEAISTERYYAICEPLKSRRWQTLSHSYKVICVIWLAAFIVMVPIATFTKVISIVSGGHACREIWDDHVIEKMYTVLLDAVLLVMPLVVMGYSYAMVSRELWINTSEPELPKSPSGTVLTPNSLSRSQKTRFTSWYSSNTKLPVT